MESDDGVVRLSAAVVLEECEAMCRSIYAKDDDGAKNDDSAKDDAGDDDARLKLAERRAALGVAAGVLPPTRARSSS